MFLSLERQLIPATDGLLFESQYAQRRYHAHVGGQEINQRVAFNGLLPEEFTRPPLIADASDLLFIGELRDAKGIDVLLRAIASVENVRSNVPSQGPHEGPSGRNGLTATIVGEGGDRAALEALARELGIAERVRFVGAKPAREAFTLGRVMVVPSRWESFPYVVLEAAAAAIPLISTNVGGIPEIVEGTTTTLIDPDDVAALAHRIEATLSAPEVALAKAAELRTRVGARFTVATMTDDICALYETCKLELAA